MALRAVLLTLILLLPLQASASRYVVRAGDSLGAIAARYHVSLATLVELNGIRNANVVQIGRTLVIPDRSSHGPSYYRVRWGDTLIGIAARFSTTVLELHRLNPALGAYPLAGQMLEVCAHCGGEDPAQTTYHAALAGSATAVSYRVQPGDSLSSIAARFGTSAEAVARVNGLTNPNVVVIGSWLAVPRAIGALYDPWTARSLIVSYARIYGIDPALPLAIGWQESGFNQSMVSKTGAIGVMQVEPYTGAHISRLVGRTLDLHDVRDNVHAGVYWLSQLLAFYGGNTRLAVAAYYEGTRNIARHGLYTDTIQYVGNVMALTSRFAE